jgi:hypothetical protein
MSYCLRKKELDILVDASWDTSGLEEEHQHLKHQLSQCEFWESEVYVLMYLLSKTLERNLKSGVDCAPIIEKVIQQSTDTWLSLQGFDSKFISYMFRNLRDNKMNLEDNLVEIQENLGGFIYE